MMAPINFIDKTTRAIMKLADDMDEKMAEVCGHTLIGSVTGGEILVLDRDGYSSADLMSIIFGPSGSNKTRAFNPVIKALKQIGEQLVFPATFNKVSLPFMLSKRKVETDEKDAPVLDGFEEVESDEYMYPNYGLIPWNEASSMFSDSKGSKPMFGAIELLSAIYDHRFDASFFKKDDAVTYSQFPYVSLLSNTVTDYFGHIPDDFYLQGTAGRLHWVHVKKIRPKPLDEQPALNDTSNIISSEEEFEEITKQLKKLHDYLHNNRSNPIIVYTDDEASSLLQAFKHKIGDDAFFLYSNNLMGGKDSHYLHRLPEMAKKAALRYYISDNIENIEAIGKCKINKSQMERGIKFAEDSHNALQELFSRKATPEKMSKPELALRALYNAKQNMLNTPQWQHDSHITNKNYFTKTKDKLLKQGKVIEVEKSSIIDEGERERLGADSPNMKIYTLGR